MDYVECPECLGIARRMPVLSYINRSENFYQCENCQQVSCMPKDESRPPVSFRFSLEQQAPSTQPSGS